MFSCKPYFKFALLRVNAKYWWWWWQENVYIEIHFGDVSTELHVYHNNFKWQWFYRDNCLLQGQLKANTSRLKRTFSLENKTKQNKTKQILNVYNVDENESDFYRYEHYLRSSENNA